MASQRLILRLLSTFIGLQNNLLTDLYLNDNQIKTIGRKALEGLPYLQKIRLHNNQLTHVFTILYSY